MIEFTSIQYASNEHTIQTYFHCVLRQTHLFCETFELFELFVVRNFFVSEREKRKINFIVNCLDLKKAKEKKIIQNKKDCENGLEIEINHVKCLEQYI